VRVARVGGNVAAKRGCLGWLAGSSGWLRRYATTGLS
jgi:hypothetical protein